MTGDNASDGKGFWPLVALILLAPACMAACGYLLFRFGTVPALGFSLVAMIPVALLWQFSETPNPARTWRDYLGLFSGSFAVVAGAPSALILYLCNSGGTNAGLGECFERFGLAQATLGAIAFTATLVAVLINAKRDPMPKRRKRR